MDKNQAIGFFDSGIGGLSILAAVRKHLPFERFLYLGDSAHAPYGTKTEEEVRALTLAAVKQLASQGIKALVVACNTATGAAVDALRENHLFPVIGIEPALKLAFDSRKQGLILVMATPLTLSSKKYRRLFSQYGEHAVSLACPGLMDFVEREELDSPALHNYLRQLFAPYRQEPIDSVVLGCTHYLFLRQALQQHLPDATRLLDSNEGVTRQLIHRLQEKNLLADAGSVGSVIIQSTGGSDKVDQLHRMLKIAQGLF